MTMCEKHGWLDSSPDSKGCPGCALEQISKPATPPLSTEHQPTARHLAAAEEIRASIQSDVRYFVEFDAYRLAAIIAKHEQGANERIIALLKRVGDALNWQNELWGLYGNESQAALREFKSWNPAAESLPSLERERNGNWLDKWGACKVCDGEIPHGHTDKCDIYKLEIQARELVDALRGLWSAPISGNSDVIIEREKLREKARVVLAKFDALNK